MPSVPSATRSPSRASGARPTPLFMFERGVVDDRGSRHRGPSPSRSSSRWTQCASERSPVERAGGGEPRDHSPTESRLGVPFVHGVLGDVDVEAGAVLEREPRTGRQRVLGQSERGVRADHGREQRRGPRQRPREEPGVLGDARPCDRRPVAVARLVTQHGPDAEFGERVGDDVERAVDRRRRRVVVDQRRRAREQRLEAADQRRRADRRLVERPVEAPPDPAAGCRGSSAAARGGTACRARAPSRGGCARRRCRARPGTRSSRCGDSARGCIGRPGRDDPAALDEHVGRSRRRAGRSDADDRPAGQQQAHGRSRPRRWVSRWRRRVRPRQPRDGRPRRRRVAHRQARPPDAVERVQGAGDGRRGRHEDRLAGPLRSVRALGLRLLDDDAVDRRHPRCRDDPECLHRLGHAAVRPRCRTPRSARSRGPCGRRPRSGPRARAD